MKLIDRFAEQSSRFAGSSTAFLIAVAIVIVWGGTGPFLHYSDFWQLTINTGTTICTFLLAFLIQNAQNRQASLDRRTMERDAEVNRLAESKIDALTEDMQVVKRMIANMVVPHE